MTLEERHAILPRRRSGRTEGGLFADTAVRLAGLAGVMFGWRPDEFWAATPDELAALMRALVPEESTPPDATTIARMQEAYPDG